MAKKKRKHRHPVAPPVHSAPGAVVQPSGPRPAQPATPQPEGSVAPPAGPAAYTAEPVARRPAPARRKPTRRRRRSRTPFVIGGIVALIVLAIVAQQVLGNRSSAAFDALARAAGCGSIRSTGSSGGMEHLRPGEKTTYDTSPPTHGPHAATPLSAGAYEKPLSTDPNKAQTIFQAVHSLEHGAVIVWHDGLSNAQESDLKDRYGDEDKVLVVPYRKLTGKTHMALTAWGKLVSCQKATPKFIDAFVDKYRESRDAPEPRALI